MMKSILGSLPAFAIFTPSTPISTSFVEAARKDYPANIYKLHSFSMHLSKFLHSFAPRLLSEKEKSLKE